MAILPAESLSLLIKQKAADLGFDLCGIAGSRPLTEREPILKNWCETGMNAGMNYLARDTSRRINPGAIVPGARSLVVTGISYYSEQRQREAGVPVLSRYVYGENYHDVISRKLETLLKFINIHRPDEEGKIFVDSGPLMEKAWAVEAGLGCQGRHSIVINRETGSFFFIGILVLNSELEYDKPFKEDLCEGCRLCIDLCPTGAINENRTIDARRCISNLTIENRGEIPDEFKSLLGGRVYGCDRCQEVCPWNRDAKQNNHPEFEPSAELMNMTRDEWLNLSEDRFNKLFAGSEIARKKYAPFMKNVTIVTK